MEKTVRTGVEPPMLIIVIPRRQSLRMLSRMGQQLFGVGQRSDSGSPQRLQGLECSTMFDVRILGGIALSSALLYVPPATPSANRQPNLRRAIFHVDARLNQLHSTTPKKVVHDFLVRQHPTQLAIDDHPSLLARNPSPAQRL